MVSIGRSALVICYQGDVCDFLFNQLQTSITANKNIAKRAYRGLTAAFAPVNSFAFAA